MLPIFAEGIRRREENLAIIRQRAAIRTENNAFELPDRRFIELFRLNKQLTRNLIEMIRPHFYEPIRRWGITLENAVLASLRFYATGCYQRAVGQDFNLGLSQTSVSRCIHRVTEIIDQYLSEEFIQFPLTRDQRQTIKAGFMEKYGFPGVVGAIDGTHIAILKPELNEHNYINRKGYHSLNVQIICDSNQKVMNIFANYGGSTHDSFIWRHLNIQRIMNHLHTIGERNSWLIGDSGYPLQPYLLTPIPDALPGTPEDRYNQPHIQARGIIERSIGLLKMRFRSLLKERVARYKPNFVSSLVTACATLHNMCIDAGLPLIHEDVLEEENMNMGNIPLVRRDLNLYNEGLAQRANVVLRYFTNI